eukprot:scaffold54025_cov66-Cyclotella_meneghiniana.AAC.2
MNDPLVLSQICIMLQQEKNSSYKCSDYLSRTQAIGPTHRESLCKWGYHTIAACHGVSRLTAVVAFGYFDRFLSSNTPAANRALNDVTECQLAFVTSCLVIALKIHSGFNVETNFVSNVITKKSYDAEEINDMELLILQSLSWKLNGPTPHDFIDYFLEVMPYVDGTCLDLAKQLSKALVEAAVVRYTTVLHYPSEVAFASLCCALHHVDVSLLNNLPFLQIISGLDLRHGKMRLLFESMIPLLQEVSYDLDNRATIAFSISNRQEGETSSYASTCSQTSDMEDI